jgi:hypothetical protein
MYFLRRVPLALLFAIATQALWAQLYSGSLTGTVLDPSGAPVANANVTLSDIDQGVRRATISDRRGRYFFWSLSPGNYSVTIEAEGFEPYASGNLSIDVNANLSADARLQVASQRERVLVEADSAPAEADNATLGLVLDRENIYYLPLVDRYLPLVDRNPFDLAFLAPGVSQAPGTTYGNGTGTPGFITNFVSGEQCAFRSLAAARISAESVSLRNPDSDGQRRGRLHDAWAGSERHSSPELEPGSAGTDMVTGHSTRAPAIAAARAEFPGTIQPYR